MGLKDRLTGKRGQEKCSRNLGGHQGTQAHKRSTHETSTPITAR